ncbi:MAG: response regulator transcription factor [Micrococcales bacterium]|nr:response regulator transcription factor [Micrococcales bacterium]
MTITVLLAEDQRLVREGLAMMLSAESDIVVVGQAADGHQALAAVQATPVDVVVMDVRMPGMDGIEATRRLTADNASRPDSPVRVLVLTTFDDDAVLYGALRAGASGYMLKHDASAELAPALRRIAAGEAWIDPMVAPRVIEVLRQMATPATGERPTVDMLTPREREVLVLMAEGLSNPEITERLVLSEATVKTHVSRILMKTGSRDRAQAVVLAYRSGLVSP